ncbi:MAG: type II toxin-antitoxin system PemK/MazF family toxin [Bacillota bacterium]
MSRDAKQGEFYFAKFLTVTGNIREAPVFIVGNDGDDEDIIICSYTAQPPKTQFDIKVMLKRETYVRTNKIYTIQRNQLLNKLNVSLSTQDFANIMSSVRLIFNL